ncbi:MAG: T9SS type A sorting domain-containing protein [Candidatus Latescibacteria bacterium]|nr:T9SS type A sorting domain-containing protein [bacterium]MBD3423045.1 T9SS type A sorting domain-containing protein [Candidatus Latescibacterota bacterium]
MFNNLKLAVFFIAGMLVISVPALHAEWSDNGIPLGNASGAQDSPRIAADSTGGAVVTWRDSRATVNTDIYAQGVDDEGTIRWYPQGMPACTATNSQSTPRIVADGAGGTIIVWQDNRSGGTLDIYAQKLSMIGYIQWGTNGVAICTGQPNLNLGAVVSDGAGGAIITWQDRRNYYNDIFAQRIASNGSVMWGSGGVPVCTENMHQQNPVMAPDGSSGAIIAWEDRRDGGYDIYAQRIDSGGTAQWTAGGEVICDSGENQMTPRIVPDGSGGAVIAWSDRRNTMDFDIFAQRINASGELQWGFGTPVSAWMGDQKDCQLVHIGGGETVVTWIDTRSGTSDDIYAQKINAAGSCQWSSNGVVVCGEAQDQANPAIAGNGAGGTFIAWDDERAGTDDINIYAQNIDSGGSALWTAGGELMCGSSGNQQDVAICEDGLGGIFLAWADNRSGTVKAYAHRVNASGCIPTATLLQEYAAERRDNGVMISWTLSEIDPEVEFSILRASEPDMQYHQIPVERLSRDGMSFSFTDTDCRPGSVYSYRVSYHTGTETGLLFESGPVSIPEAPTSLCQNMPNPFNPATTIEFTLSSRTPVRLAVFDVSGRMIKVLAEGTMPAGEHQVVWRGQDEQGNQASSGVYFYRLRTGAETLVRKMVLLR